MLLAGGHKLRLPDQINPSTSPLLAVATNLKDFPSIRSARASRASRGEFERKSDSTCAIFGIIFDIKFYMRHYRRMKASSPILQEIKAARLAKGLTQEEFARAAGIPRRTYQRLESGDPGTRIDTLFRALNALGLTIKTASRGRPTLDELSELYGNDA